MWYIICGTWYVVAGTHKTLANIYMKRDSMKNIVLYSIKGSEEQASAGTSIKNAAIRSLAGAISAGARVAHNPIGKHTFISDILNFDGLEKVLTCARAASCMSAARAVDLRVLGLVFLFSGILDSVL